MTSFPKEWRAYWEAWRFILRLTTVILGGGILGYGILNAVLRLLIRFDYAGQARELSVVKQDIVAGMICGFGLFVFLLSVYAGRVRQPETLVAGAAICFFISWAAAFAISGSLLVQHAWQDAIRSGRGL